VTVNDGNTGDNYNVSYASNTASTINKATLTVAAGAVTKTYDGTTSATGTATAVSGLGTGDTLSGGSFAFTNANAGTGNKTVTASGVTVNDGHSGANYNALVYQDNTSSTINKADITVSTGNVSKTYDGTTTASGTLTLSAGTLYTNASNGNTLDTLSGGSFAFSNANAGTANKTVMTSGVTVNDGHSGGNYNVSYAANTTSTINKADITVSTSAVTKTYDGTTTAAGTATLSSGTLYTNASNGHVQDSLSGGAFAFTDRNAGTANKTVTVSGVTVNDGNTGDNYNVSYASNTASTINRATLTITPTTQTRSYDGTTTSSAVATVSGVQTGDSVTAVVQAFDSRNAGARTLGIVSYTLSDGNGGNNYNVNSSGTVAGTLNKADLTVSTNNVTKTYDGTTTATGTATAVSGLGTGDSLSGGSFAFTDKNAGTGDKTVTVAGVTVNDGNGGNNYNPISYASNTGSTINKATLTVGALGVNKVYDASTAASVTLTDDHLGADVLNLAYTGTSFVDKNVGNGKVVSVSGITVTGADAGNYNANTSATATADITPATISQVTGITAANKTFDGNTTATPAFAGASFNGLYGGDTLRVGGASAQFVDSGVGVGKTVNIRGITLAGADAGNYRLADTTATALASINALPLDLTYVAHHAPMVNNGSGAGSMANQTAGNNLGTPSQATLLTQDAGSTTGNGSQATSTSQAPGGSNPARATSQGSGERNQRVRQLNSWVDVVDNGVLIAP
jgi:galactitol-specific phosphotransferase system IIB component